MAPPSADMVVDESKRLVGNEAGLALLAEEQSRQSDEKHRLSDERLISVLMKLETYLSASQPNVPVQTEYELWASGFEWLYGMSYDYGKRISRGSKMVALANTRCDLQLLDAFQSNRANISQRDAIIRLWKSAIDTQRVPEGVFELPAVIRMYNKIISSFHSGL
ncbi:uncharacterized protein MCYG_02836 [Microsporum canis CBS 113480]|uniref:Uncharacterized protein n=1 Tax=Arthroderma otae (strain ATCC MYA-4605 / CBS 113480) TaxID=554155 RepID=C5FJZ5_ARTOC|nr:uncharacterized protein MCYG_02836 [Microsporum canis CBS 113480]EEQ30017.1 predicted protein [Microsporum canis CBS 113480]